MEFQNITKSFPGVKALNDVSFGILPGTVHVLVGENGAGKSTLFKVINGLYKADEGKVLFEGELLETNGPSDSLKKGISMIYQELNIIPEMTVLENMFLGRELLTPAGLVDYKRMEKEASQYLKQQGLTFNLKSKMKDLSIAEAQMLEIVKSISANAKVILMDEPTSSLTEKEVDFLFKKIKELRDSGITIIYVSHKMEEIFEIGEFISVLRDGEHVYTSDIKETNIADIIEKMVGRKMEEVYPENNSQIKDVIFSVKNFSKKGVFDNISFDVRAGEILGVSGLIGAGRTEIARAILGMDPKDSGEVYFNGETLKIKTVNDAISKGIVMVPEDRKRLGLNLIGTVDSNITLVSLAHVFNSFVLKFKNMKKLVKKMMDDLRIKAPSSQTIVQTLSGGNQQKVVLGKWLSVNPKVLFLDEPTRGIDVGTKYEIYKLMRELCSKGNAIILIDSDLNELIGMSDRVMVIREGKKAGILEKEEICPNRIMHLAALGGEAK
ncbi:MAG: sugar ABC transporter ATP-binding protein [Christensenellaceae bacterium]|nr:sugar ABC transporter ATP-binding protein [Christensenellaceae bacterium]